VRELSFFISYLPAQCARVIAVVMRIEIKEKTLELFERIFKFSTGFIFYISCAMSLFSIFIIIKQIVNTKEYLTFANSEPGLMPTLLIFLFLLIFPSISYLFHRFMPRVFVTIIQVNPLVKIV
jgi:hypothetical protein